MTWVIGLSTAVFLSLFLYWQIVITEGVFLGRRVVVWLYDLLAHRYDPVKKYDFDDERELVVEPFLVGIRTLNPKVLDVATGTGRVPFFLSRDKRFQGKITAIDLSDKMLAFAREKTYAKPIDFQQLPAVPLRFPDHSFDAVICLEALEFMPSDEEALQEMVRVLKPNGFLMVTRRRGWEAWTFLHRYRSPKKFETILKGFGIKRIHSAEWQSNYDLVTGYKRSES